MKTVAIVPVKSLSQAKSRLAGQLSAYERADLMLEMLAHVLGTIAGSGMIDQIAVISPNPEELPLPLGVTALPRPNGGLNAHLEQGREWAMEQGAGALLIAFADLPMLTPLDVARIVRLGEQENTVVLAPDRHGHGTNIMLLHPPDLIPFNFGAGSFDKHRTDVESIGANLEIYLTDNTALDIDTPDDLDVLEKSRIAAG